MLPLNLDKSATTTLQDQIASSIREMIRSRVLKRGTRLPPTRSLARAHGVARNTVSIAYEVLSAEGYLEARLGSGTFVAESLPEECLTPAVVAPREQSQIVAERPQVAFQGQAPTRPTPIAKTQLISLMPGRPDHRQFPMHLVRRWSAEHLPSASRALTGYGDPVGLEGLRQEIARHLAEHRGLGTDPQNVVITSGTQEALNLICRALVIPSRRIAIEDPCYQGAALCFESYGAVLDPVPVDAHGLCADQLPQDATLAYVTPSHQFPLGGTLPLVRRQILLDWAQATGAYIIEDDYDSDYRYDGPPLTALASMAPQAVIYLGTLSKSLGAGMRLGYMVVPRELKQAIETAKILLDFGTSWMPQHFASFVLSEGSFAQHLRRIRRSYMEKRDVMLTGLSGLSQVEEILGAGGGMHLSVRLRGGREAVEAVIQACHTRGVIVQSCKDAGGIAYQNCEASKFLILGYTGPNKAELLKASTVLRESISQIQI